MDENIVDRVFSACEKLDIKQFRERVLCHSSEDDACSFSSVRILYIFVHVCSVYMCSWMCVCLPVCVCTHVCMLDRNVS